MVGLAERLSGIFAPGVNPAPNAAPSGPNPFDSIFNAPAQAAAPPKPPKEKGGGFLGHGFLGDVVNVLTTPLHLITATGATLGRTVGALEGQHYGPGNGPSLSNFLSMITNPNKEINGTDIIQGNISKGLNKGLFSASGAQATANPNIPTGSIFKTELPPLGVAIAGLGLDVAADPLTYVAPMGEIHGAQEIAGHISDVAAENIGKVLGRTGVEGRDILAGENLVDHLAPASESQIQKIADIKRGAADAIQTVQSKGVSGLSKAQVAEYGGEGLIQKGLGVGGLRLTSGEGPLSKISEGSHFLQGKLGDILLGSNGETRLFGKLGSNPEGEVLARSASDLLERLAAITQNRIRNTSRLIGSTQRSIIERIDAEATKGMSSEELQAARDVTNGDASALERTSPEAVQKISDANRQVAQILVDHGVLPEKALIPEGQYFPSPIAHDIHEALQVAGLGTKAQGEAGQTFLTKGRTLWDPESGIGGVGFGKNRITFEAASRAEAERKAASIVAEKLKAAAGAEGSGAAKFLADNPELARQVESGSVPLFQEPREALATRARAAGRAITRAQAGSRLFRAGVGEVDPRLVAALQQVAPEASGGAASAAGVSAPAASAAAPVMNVPGVTELQGGTLRDLFAKQYPDAAAAAGGVPEAMPPVLPSTGPGTPGPAEVPAAADTIPATTETPSPVSGPPTTPDQAQTTYAQTTSKIAERLPPEAGPVIEASTQTGTLQDWRANPQLAHDTADQTIASAQQTISSGVPDDPVVQRAQDIAKQATDWKQALDAGDPKLAEVARQHILALSHDITVTEMGPGELERWSAAIESDPKALATILNGQAHQYAQYTMLQPGIMTPQDAADAVMHTTQFNPVEMKNKWTRFVAWTKKYQLASPGQAVKVGFGGIWNNALQGVDVGSETAVGKAMLSEQAGKDVTDSVYQQARKLVGPSQGIIEPSDQLAGKGLSWNPLSTKGPLVRASMAGTSEAIDYTRLVSVYDVLAKGGTENDAVAMLHKFHFDYTDLSPLEQKLKANLFPFFTFTKNNLPLQMEQLVNNPKMFARFFEAQQSIQSQSQADKIVPAYFLNSLAIRLPWQQGGGHNYVLPNLPIKDLGLPLESLQGAAGAGGFGNKAMAAISPLLGQTASPLTGIVGALQGEELYNNIPLHDNTPVPLSQLHIPGWLAPALKLTGMVKTGGPKGTPYITQRDEYLIQKTLPFLGRAFRVGASAEPRYKNAFMGNLLSFLVGQPVQTNTKDQQGTADYIKSLETKRLKSIYNKLSPGYNPKNGRVTS